MKKLWGPPPRSLSHGLRLPTRAESAQASYTRGERGLVRVSFAVPRTIAFGMRASMPWPHFKEGM